MKKLNVLLSGLSLFPMMAICLRGLSPVASAEGLYNAREELEYTRRASIDRQDERNQQIRFQQYQQQQYMDHQRLMNQQSMYDQTHRRGSELSSILIRENP